MENIFVFIIVALVILALVIVAVSYLPLPANVYWIKYLIIFVCICFAAFKIAQRAKIL